MRLGKVLDNNFSAEPEDRYISCFCCRTLPQAAKPRVQHLHDLILVKIAGTGDDNIPGAVITTDVAHNVVPGEGCDGVPGAKYRLSQPFPSPYRLGEKIMHIIVRSI